jgi:glycosyltransferase involved in cell wall biosynthesis
MKIPVISVIIPTYNRASYVVLAIDSVLNQSYKDYEIIVVDDGSTDDTKVRLDKYKDEIRYIYQNNSGVSSARNTGIMASRGEWVAFLDSDDEWDEDYLSTQIEQKTKYPDSIAYITNSDTFHFDGRIDNHFKGINIAKYFKNSTCLSFERPITIIIEHGYWFLQAIIIRKDILLEAGLFDQRLFIAEDLDIICRVAVRGRFTICKHEKVKIIRRDEKIDNLSALSRKNMHDRCRTYIQVHSKLLSNPDLNQNEKISVKRILSLHIRLLGNMLLLDGKKKEAQEQYRKAFKQYASVRTFLKIILCTMPVSISKSFTKNIQY